MSGSGRGMEKTAYFCLPSDTINMRQGLKRRECLQFVVGKPGMDERII
jgi:hypothetical protein